MIPTCLKLKERQTEKLNKFLKFLRTKVSKDYQNEDVSMASEFVYKIYATGLGDVINVEALGYKCSLTIDDDNELIDDEHWLKEI